MSEFSIKRCILQPSILQIFSYLELSTQSNASGIYNEKYIKIFVHETLGHHCESDCKNFNIVTYRQFSFVFISFTEYTTMFITHSVTTIKDSLIHVLTFIFIFLQIQIYNFQGKITGYGNYGEHHQLFSLLVLLVFTFKCFLS